MAASLILRSGSKKGRETPLSEGVYLVGRSKACQIRPKNKMVSRRHAAILCQGSTVVIQDIGSKTGTYVNRERIPHNKTITLNDGDKIQFGNTRFRLKLVPAETPDRPPAPAVALQDAQRETNEDAFQSPSNANSGSVAEAPGHDAFDDDLVTSCPSPSQAENDSVVIQAADESTIVSKDDSFDSRVEDIDSPERPSARGQDDEPHQDELPDDFNILDLLEEPKELEREPGFDSKVDLEELASDSDVDFAAPNSAESIESEDQALPSYSLRQDWDVQGARKWANKLVDNDEPKPKPQFESQKPKSTQAPKTSLMDRFDPDLLKTVGIVLGFGLILAVMAYNVYQLVYFEG